VRSLIERAAAAKCSALVLTVDLQVLGQRHADIRNGLSVPPKLTLKSVLDMASRPAWLCSVLAGRRWTFGNLDGHVGGMKDAASLAQWVGSQFDPTLSWKDLEWIRGLWRGKLVVKGILDVDDAQRCVESGADSLVVSNHGGRQLDGASSSISMLAAIADAVGSGAEVLFDGGIRTGQDVLRALALGAKGCLVGRPYVFGLAAGGERGVRLAIELLRRELDVSMALTGVRHIGEIGRHILAEDVQNRGRLREQLAVGPG
jgi:L-lactate dehydrogenase (cytochrome)